VALISPAYTRDDLVAMIEQREALISALKETVEETVREREDYNGKHQGAVIEIERLRAAILRIDAINDSPARFSFEINKVCDAILRPHLTSSLTSNKLGGE
jgi:hypothetical protein